MPLRDTGKRPETVAFAPLSDRPITARFAFKDRSMPLEGWPEVRAGSIRAGELYNISRHFAGVPWIRFGTARIFRTPAGDPTDLHREQNGRSKSVQYMQYRNAHYDLGCTVPIDRFWPGIFHCQATKAAPIASPDKLTASHSSLDVDGISITPASMAQARPSQPSGRNR